MACEPRRKTPVSYSNGKSGEVTAAERGLAEAHADAVVAADSELSTRWRRGAGLARTRPSWMNSLRVHADCAGRGRQQRVDSPNLDRHSVARMKEWVSRFL